MLKKYLTGALTLTIAGTFLFLQPANAEMKYLIDKAKDSKNKVVQKGLYGTSTLNAEEQKTAPNTAPAPGTQPQASNTPLKEVTMEAIKAMDFSYYTQRNITFDDYRLAGMYYYNIGDFDNAIISFQQALALRPEDDISKGWLEAAKNSRLILLYKLETAKSAGDSKSEIK